MNCGGYRIRRTKHLCIFFFNCDSTNVLLVSFFNLCFSNVGINNADLKKLFFGIVPEYINDKALALITALYIQYLIWDSKLKGRLPALRRLKCDLFYFLKSVYKVKRGIFNNDANFVLSRNWPDFSRNGLI
jgi:hypothetical protein